VYFAEPDARRLAGHPDTVDAIALRTEPGADVGQVAAAVDEALRGSGAVVRTGDERGVAEFP
jgi:putative ABC transport system permease protein